jgi:hypothetical protein
MARPTRVGRNISARKKQAGIAGLHEGFDELAIQTQVLIGNAKLAQTLARTELIKTAQALLPKARTLAARGRPRLLAVVSKIILDRHLQFIPNTKRLEEKIARMQRQLAGEGQIQ